ncbi:protein WVD2-like 4 [Sesamum indicum]|uniref:Protein WVD2-like 4 n=1 Tax=Sesamum indicum TaxID=4182 RepID=A0A6I9T2L2_SESIN|nr:protein WVD2-like 4 [Sesamum indicum]XP_020549308.1 protein WVD2-like 4 [Sesamum indicum]
MESENGVPHEDEKKVIVEKPNGEGSTDLDVNKENIRNSDEPFSGGNKDEIKDKQGHNSPGPELELELSATVHNNKTSNPGKDSSSNGPKSNKLAKNQSNSKISVVFGRSTKPSLTQSLSFPAKGRHSDVMKRSIEVYPTRSDLRQSQKNGNLSSSPRTNPAGKGPYPGVSSKGVGSAGKAAASRSVTSSSLSGKNTSANEAVTKSAPDTLIEQSSETASAAKEDDTHSTTSSNLTPRAQQRKMNVLGFSSRLQERAEKRKEFFSKIEEKVHAKEVEKNNLQAKSKENQEAEIKQLRKSLTFKATPMPTFYKEPPPKVELKKIPTTRPISPKLGRNKGTTVENSGSCVSPRVSKDNCKSPRSPHANSDKVNAALKKSIKSSLSKSHTRDSTTARKAKTAETEGQDKKAPTQSSEEIQDRPHCSQELEDDPEKKSSCSNGSNLASSDHEVVPAEVTVEG